MQILGSCYFSRRDLWLQQHIAGWPDVDFFKLFLFTFQDPELHSLAADLALQSQILEAARRLSMENHLSKPQKKSRLQQCKREEKKFKDLQEAVTRQRARSERSSPQTAGSAHSMKGEGTRGTGPDGPCPLAAILVLNTKLILNAGPVFDCDSL